LAENWEVSPDGMTYTFYLKENVTFHDDTPFDADAVAVTFDRITNPNYPGWRPGKSLDLLGPSFASYTIIDDYTFQISLSASYVPLLDALSQPYWGIASPTALANTTTDTYQWHQVGTGPYRLVEVIPGDRIVLERNEDYAWGPVFYAPPNERSIKRIVFRFFDDAATRRIALEAGDVDIIGELPPTDAEALLGEREFQIYEQPIPGQPLQYYFNTTRPLVSNQQFRQALLHATQRDAIVDAVFFRDLSPVAYGPLAANSPYYNPAVQEMYPYNPQRAREIFGIIGLTEGENGMLEFNGNPIKLKIVIAGWSFLPEVTALLQNQWREIGIDSEILQVAGLPALQEAATAGDYDLITFQDYGLDPVILNSAFHTEGFFNWSNYSDAELDGWLIQALAVDEANRVILYNQIQQRIMDQAIIVPIRDQVNLIGWTDELEGLIFSGQGWWPLLTNLQVKSDS
jgi:peptide/nickel transport system substrate-binding protein